MQIEYSVYLIRNKNPIRFGVFLLAVDFEGRLDAVLPINRHLLIGLVFVRQPAETRNIHVIARDADRSGLSGGIAQTEIFCADPIARAVLGVGCIQIAIQADRIYLTPPNPPMSYTSGLELSVWSRRIGSPSFHRYGHHK